jgi:hypothetical protein
LEHPKATSLLPLERISKFLRFLHTQRPSWLYKCKFHQQIKSKGDSAFPRKPNPPRGLLRGVLPPKWSHFSQKTRFKYAKYDSTRASEEFMRGASIQKEKTRKSEIAYASSRIRPFSLATLPTSYSWNRILPAQIRPGKGKKRRNSAMVEIRTSVQTYKMLMVYFGAPSMFITLWFGFDYGTNPPLGTLII